jgi:hypothetical protein
MISQKTMESPNQTGKPEDCAKPSTSKAKEREPLSSGSSGTEGVLSFPQLERAHNEQLLPCYSTILNLTEEEVVRLEDLDSLQLELEAMLSTVELRRRVLQVSQLIL